MGNSCRFEISTMNGDGLFLVGGKPVIASSMDVNESLIIKVENPTNTKGGGHGGIELYNSLNALAVRVNGKVKVGSSVSLTISPSDVTAVQSGAHTANQTWQLNGPDFTGGRLEIAASGALDGSRLTIVGAMTGTVYLDAPLTGGGLQTYVIAITSMIGGDACLYNGYIDLNSVADRAGCEAVCATAVFTPGCNVTDCKTYCAILFP
jgi:hypothetical protein